jgi:hypothetical protein
MRFETVALIALSVLLTSTYGAGEQQSEKSAAPSPAYNDTSLVNVPEKLRRPYLFRQITYGKDIPGMDRKHPVMSI